MTTRTLVAAGLYLVPAILFTRRSPGSSGPIAGSAAAEPLFKLIPIVATVLAVHIELPVERGDA